MIMAKEERGKKSTLTLYVRFGLDNNIYWNMQEASSVFHPVSKSQIPRKI